LTAKRFYPERESTCFDEHHLPSISEGYGVQTKGWKRSFEPRRRVGQLDVPLSTSAPPRVEGRPRRADHRLPLELNCQSENVKSDRRSKRDGRKGKPHRLLPFRADYLTRGRESGSRHSVGGGEK
jgi:hypothetical protein